ncbi:MAG: energy transducer TonB [Acidobacteriaceae bacterium]
MPYIHETWNQREPVVGSWFGSFALHLGLGAAIVLSMYLHVFHENRWGQISTGPTINATLVSSAPSLPLPNPQITNNTVLATQTPSPAPLLPEPKAAAIPDETAIPIKARQQHIKKVAPKETPKPPKYAQPQKEQHRATYGEAAPSSVPMSTPSSQEKSVVVQNGDFGSRFGWYVDMIKRAVAQNWYSQLADPKASMGHSAIVTFEVHRDGSLSNPRIAQSSGVPSLDLSAIQAVERVGSIGPLPPGYSGSSISVAYTFTYDASTRP